MARNAKLILGIGIFALIVAIIAVYGYTQSRQFLLGPQITIISPKNGGVFTENPITIQGLAKNISHITLDDNGIFVDSKGGFSEKLLLLPGYNILTIEAQDRFGKKAKKTLELVFEEPMKEIVASSTPKSI